MMDVEKDIRMLQEVYFQAFERVSKRIISGGAAESDAELLAAINKELKKLDKYNKDFVDKVIPNVYGKNRKNVVQYLKELGVDVTENKRFRSIHSGAVEELQQRLMENMNEGINQIHKNAVANVKGITKQASLLHTAGASTELEAVKVSVTKIINSGINKVRYKNGAMVDVTKYVEMAVRTNVDSAINKSTENQQLEFGLDLIQISYHSTSCPICSPYQNRIYSISGNSEEYPSINVINNGNYAEYGVIHPNCRHRAIPYIPQYDGNEKKNKIKSNKPFEDNRTEYSKERYKERQKANRYGREIERLDEELKLLKTIKNKSTEVKQEIIKTSSKIREKKARVDEVAEWEADTIKDNPLFKEEQ